jgi:hypothetical protein
MAFSSMLEVHQTPFFLFFTDPKQDTTTLLSFGLSAIIHQYFFSDNKSTISIFHSEQISTSHRLNERIARLLEQPL